MKGLPEFPKIKSCPFCDMDGIADPFETARGDIRWHIVCTGCNIRVGYGESELAAIIEWNIRPREEALADALKGFVDQLDDEDTGGPGLSASDWIAHWDMLHKQGAMTLAEYGPAPELGETD